MAHSILIALSFSEREESKRQKHKEYNREAQRTFRRRRKEHLGNLEIAQRRHDIEKNTELQVLRSKNKQLVEENGFLRLVQRNRYLEETRANIRHAQFASLIYAPLDAYSMTTASTTIPPAPPLEACLPTASTASSLPVLLPSNIAELRSTLHQLFSPILCSDPGYHLQALRLLSPALPLSLKPTCLQLTIPHNPHIDMLPSAVLRDRLIVIGPVLSKAFLTQVCTVAFDIEDNGQITVWGENWDDSNFWEFSAPVLECWGGWLLTEEWVQRANAWRVQRGASVLES